MNELLTHYRRKGEPPIKREGSSQGHYTVFSPKLLRDIATWFNSSNFWRRLDEIAYQETDDKVGNGHTIVWQVRKYSSARGL